MSKGGKGSSIEETINGKWYDIKETSVNVDRGKRWRRDVSKESGRENRPFTDFCEKFKLEKRSVKEK